LQNPCYRSNRIRAHGQRCDHREPQAGAAQLRLGVRPISTFMLAIPRSRHPLAVSRRAIALATPRSRRSRAASDYFATRRSSPAIRWRPSERDPYRTRPVTPTGLALGAGHRHHHLRRRALLLDAYCSHDGGAAPFRSLRQREDSPGPRTAFTRNERLGARIAIPGHHRNTQAAQLDVEHRLSCHVQPPPASAKVCSRSA
jgi:hypothetical protein